MPMIHHHDHHQRHLPANFRPVCVPIPCRYPTIMIYSTAGGGLPPSAASPLHSSYYYHWAALGSRGGARSKQGSEMESLFSLLLLPSSNQPKTSPIPLSNQRMLVAAVSILPRGDTGASLSRSLLMRCSNWLKVSLFLVSGLGSLCFTNGHGGPFVTLQTVRPR